MQDSHADPIGLSTSELIPLRKDHHDRTPPRAPVPPVELYRCEPRDKECAAYGCSDGRVAHVAGEVGGGVGELCDAAVVEPHHEPQPRQPQKAAAEEEARDAQVVGSLRLRELCPDGGVLLLARLLLLARRPLVWLF